MDHKDISKAKGPAMRVSIYAMRRAATLARMISIQTNTEIVVMRDGKLVHISATELLVSDDWEETTGLDNLV